MANKRILKKKINYICSELFAECVADSLYNGKREEKDVKAMLYAIISIHRNYICRVSHPEPGIKQNAYYKDLINKFNGEVGEIIDQIINHE